MVLCREGCRVTGIGVIVEVMFESTLKGMGHACTGRRKWWGQGQ